MESAGAQPAHPLVDTFGFPPKHALWSCIFCRCAPATLGHLSSIAGPCWPAKQPLASFIELYKSCVIGRSDDDVWLEGKGEGGGGPFALLPVFVLSLEVMSCSAADACPHLSRPDII